MKWDNKKDFRDQQGLPILITFLGHSIHKDLTEVEQSIDDLNV